MKYEKYLEADRLSRQIRSLENDLDNLEKADGYPGWKNIKIGNIPVEHMPIDYDQLERDAIAIIKLKIADCERRFNSL